MQATLVVLSNEHVSEVKVFNSVMATIISRQLFATSIIFIYDRRARLREPQI